MNNAVNFGGLIKLLDDYPQEIHQLLSEMQHRDELREQQENLPTESEIFLSNNKSRKSD